MKSWLIFAVAMSGIGVVGASLRTPAEELQPVRIDGHVADAVGAAIGSADIFVRRNTPPEAVVKLMTHTDKNGDFTLRVLTGGYDILVTAPGFASSVKTVAAISGKANKTTWKLTALPCDIPGMNCDQVR
jgi:hypothetical protein